VAEKYDPSKIEPKWQAKWDADDLYRAKIDPSKKKHYALTMLPYPSGDLHIGHWYAMTPSDARARFMRMRGYNVMFPIGFDAFGLPAENAAIKHKIHPKEWTYSNIDRMRKQLKRMGAMWDWHREAISADPKYYHWTQWFFIQLYKHGLAYRKKSPVDWCPSCNTTLAREQVWGEDRHCERCGTPVIRKDLEQWFFRTTNYADELLDYTHLDWPERVIVSQTNWIGRSVGASVIFQTEAGDPMEVFTTRPDTLWGATFMVLAPEHPLVQKITTAEHKEEVNAYITETTRQTDIQREATDKEKTGVFTGGYAINPVNGKKIPICIADYVLMTYGTGAIMAVPAHDERDFAFALKFGLPIIQVVERPDGKTKSVVCKDAVDDDFIGFLKQKHFDVQEADDKLLVGMKANQAKDFIQSAQHALKPGHWIEIVGTQWVFIFEDEIIPWDSAEADERILRKCQSLDAHWQSARTLMEIIREEPFYQDVLFHHEKGKMIHSESLTGTPGGQAYEKTIGFLEVRKAGKKAVNYRLRDWLISRQRYWGAPIPMIYCEKCGWQPVPEDQLPVLLPDDVEWLPTGESPLKLHPTWKKTTCPVCGGEATRETDTMDTFMCSSWYHLRYLSPDYAQGPFDPKEYDYWMPVDTYTGGIEHANMHLIYTRFFHKAGRDMGIMKGPEPMIQLRNQGIVLGEDSEKMSKSRGNVVSPDDLVEKHGADTVRAYLMFFARWDLGGPWNSNGIEGTARWLRRVWTLFTQTYEQGNATAETLRNLRRKLHKTLKNLTHDYQQFEFNTIISGLMELLNDLYAFKDAGAAGSAEWDEALDYYLRMMAPVTPYIAEELWARLGKPYSIHTQPWPEVDEKALQVDEIVLIVQVNGRLRDKITLPANVGEADAKSAALKSPTVQKFIGGKELRKVIYIPGRLINIVV